MIFELIKPFKLTRFSPSCAWSLYPAHMPAAHESARLLIGQNAYAVIHLPWIESTKIYHCKSSRNQGCEIFRFFLSQRNF